MLSQDTHKIFTVVSELGPIRSEICCLGHYVTSLRTQRQRHHGCQSTIKLITIKCYYLLLLAANITRKKTPKEMPPQTRTSAIASSSKSAAPTDELAVVEMKSTLPVTSTSDATNFSDPEATIVVDEGEEDMEVFEMVDEEGDRSAEAKDLQSKGEQRPYAIGGGSYNALKTFQGQIYSGMAVGGSHTWNYDPGVWKETKVEPDRWEINYSTTKRRARKAPKGSGVPVGAQYHWFIVGHQVRNLRSLFFIDVIIQCSKNMTDDVRIRHRYREANSMLRN
jgi:hypothetical protein